jgi:hypothetical protein
MSEIIDILTPDILECPVFVVNNAVDYIAPSIPIAPPATYRMKNTSGAAIFTKGDSYRILSAGIIFPESFSIFKRAANSYALPLLGLLTKGNPTNDVYYNPSFSGAEIFIPMENFELVLDVFCNCEETYKNGIRADNLLKENFVITAYFGNIDVSMLGVPAALNGKTFYLVPFIKVLHNQALS